MFAYIKILYTFAQNIVCSYITLKRCANQITTNFHLRNCKESLSQAGTQSERHFQRLRSLLLTYIQALMKKKCCPNYLKTSKLSSIQVSL